MTLQTFEPVLDTAGRHVLCWFCHPEQYPNMPTGYILCARCGIFMRDESEDASNEAMAVCDNCADELGI